MDKIVFFRKALGLTDPEILRDFSEAAAVGKFKKDDYIVKKGEIQSNLFFLAEGILRGFLENSKGKEATECFIYRYGQPAVGSYRLDDSPLVSIVAETESICVKVSKVKIQILMEKYPELIDIYNELLIREMEEQQDIKHAMYMYDATERYAWFLEKYGNLIERVSHRHVASFLNITPVTLSRLRKTLRENEEIC